MSVNGVNSSNPTWEAPGTPSPSADAAVLAQAPVPVEGGPTSADGNGVRAGMGASYNFATGPLSFEPAPQAPHQNAPLRAVPAASGSFVSAARNVFARVDTDHDGFLSGDELERATHDSQFTGADAAAIVAMAEGRENLEELSNDEWGDENDGITLADLNEAASQSTDVSVRSVEGTFRNVQGVAAQTDRRLFPNGIASIRAEAVHQGMTGDCYFLGALASLARQNPAAIQRMITDDGNGTYTVNFPGHGRVTVTAPTEAEIGRNATGFGDGLWVTVMEKAYVQAMHANGNTAQIDYRAANGGWPGDAIRMLTGHDSTITFTGAYGPHILAAQIVGGQSRNAVMTAWINDRWFTDHVASSQGDLPDSHIYTVVGYDSATETVTVRNPWGTGGPNGDGIMRLPLNEFRDAFTSVTVEDDH